MKFLKHLWRKLPRVSLYTQISAFSFLLVGVIIIGGVVFNVYQLHMLRAKFGARCMAIASTSAATIDGKDARGGYARGSVGVAKLAAIRNKNNMDGELHLLRLGAPLREAVEARLRRAQQDDLIIYEWNVIQELPDLLAELPDERKQRTREVSLFNPFTWFRPARESYLDCLEYIVTTGDGNPGRGKKIPPGTSIPLPVDLVPLFTEQTAIFTDVHYRDGTPWVSGYAPILDGKVTAAVLRIDEPADAYLRQQKRLFLVMGVLALLLALGAAGYHLFLKAKIERPLEAIAHGLSRVAAGDLAHTVPVLRDDELGALATTFNQMIRELRDIVTRIIDVSGQLNSRASDLETVAYDVAQGVEVQAHSTEETFSSIEDMNRTIKSIEESVASLSVNAEESSASSMELAASVEQVESIAEQLSSSVEETSAAIEQVAASLKEVADSTLSLSTQAQTTTQSVKEMHTSIAMVEANAQKSQAMSEASASNAEIGKTTVQKTITGMERIKSAVQASSEVIRRLGSRSDKIGEIVTIIDDIAEQTNLLALNASIIAAQAGEHGRSFAVVANEIRSLAERTSASIQEISELILAVQGETKEAVNSIQVGLTSVQEGSQLALRAGISLDELLHAVQNTQKMCSEIAATTVEQKQFSQTVSESMSKVAQVVQLIANSTQEQKRGSAQISTTAEEMRDLSLQVRKSTQEQLKGSQQISQSSLMVTEMVQEIHQAAKDQLKGSEQIVQAVRSISDITTKNMRSVERMSEVVETLGRQSDTLRAQISHFKV